MGQTPQAQCCIIHQPALLAFVSIASHYQQKHQGISKHRHAKESLHPACFDLRYILDIPSLPDASSTINNNSMIRSLVWATLISSCMCVSTTPGEECTTSRHQHQTPKTSPPVNGTSSASPPLATSTSHGRRSNQNWQQVLDQEQFQACSVELPLKWHGKPTNRPKGFAFLGIAIAPRYPLKVNQSILRRCSASEQPIPCRPPPLRRDVDVPPGFGGKEESESSDIIEDE